MDEILTIQDCAKILKTSTKQIYELCRRRSQERMSRPFPVFTIHAKMKRVRKKELEEWIAALIAEQRKQSGKRFASLSNRDESSERRLCYPLSGAFRAFCTASRVDGCPCAALRKDIFVTSISWLSIGVFDLINKSHLRKLPKSLL